LKRFNVQTKIIRLQARKTSGLIGNKSDVVEAPESPVLFYNNPTVFVLL